MNGWWWLSTERMTCAVKLDNGVIVMTPPILRAFVGQPPRNLGDWLRKQRGFRCERMAG